MGTVDKMTQTGLYFSSTKLPCTKMCRNFMCITFKKILKIVPTVEVRTIHKTFFLSNLNNFVHQNVH